MKFESNLLPWSVPYKVPPSAAEYICISTSLIPPILALLECSTSSRRGNLRETEHVESFSTLTVEVINSQLCRGHAIIIMKVSRETLELYYGSFR